MGRLRPRCTTHGISKVASQIPTSIRWSTPVDLDPQYAGNGALYTHYGSPAITSQNTVLVPQKTGANGGFQVNALNGSTGQQIWSLTTDYILPPYNWVPPMDITLLPDESAVAIPGAGGTVLLRKNPNSNAAHGTSVDRFFFFGKRNYNQDTAAFNSSIQICTPITADAEGNLYFGYYSDGQALPGYPSGIPSGLARILANGTGSFVAATALCNDQNIEKVVYNCGPAISTDGEKLYVAVNNGGYGYLCLVKPRQLDSHAQRVAHRSAQHRRRVGVGRRHGLADDRSRWRRLLRSA